MALNNEVIKLIRDEIGDDPDFSDDDASYDSTSHLGSLESIYNSTNRGNENILRTALICWRRRRNDYVKRGFDATASGSLMARRQRMRELDRMVKEYELLVDTTARHSNDSVLSDYQQTADSSEYT